MRLFYALPLPAPVRAHLAAQQRALQAHLPPGTVRWTTPEQQHLTLLFLGDQPEARLPECISALGAVRRHAPFGLETAELGAFPSLRRPSMLWCGVAGDVAALASVQETLAQAAGHHDPRGFHPHLTLGRARTGPGTEVRRALERAATAAESVGWTVEDVRLYSSRLGPGGARYEEMARQRLDAGNREPEAGSG